MYEQYTWTISLKPHNILEKYYLHFKTDIEEVK